MYRRFASLISAISSRNFTMRSLTGFCMGIGIAAYGAKISTPLTNVAMAGFHNSRRASALLFLHQTPLSLCSLFTSLLGVARWQLLANRHLASGRHEDCGATP